MSDQTCRDCIWHNYSFDLVKKTNDDYCDYPMTDLNPLGYHKLQGIDICEGFKLPEVKSE
jgi:hypothetical protein